MLPVALLAVPGERVLLGWAEAGRLGFVAGAALAFRAVLFFAAAFFATGLAALPAAVLPAPFGPRSVWPVLSALSRI